MHGCVRCSGHSDERLCLWAASAMAATVVRTWLCAPTCLGCIGELACLSQEKDNDISYCVVFVLKEGATMARARVSKNKNKNKNKSSSDG